ncbi:MAG: OsmC family protein [Desulfobacteraceae bacterium]|nr:OsmC family protein [Desulfobacteraceae bacterium]
MKQHEIVKNNQNDLFRVEAVLRPGQNRRMVGRVGDHIVEMDVSKQHGGDGSSPNPPQYLALSLAGCLMNMSRIIAAEQDIRIEDIEISISGEIDTDKAMGISSENRAGFAGLNAIVRIQAQWSAEEKSLFHQELDNKMSDMRYNTKSD